MTYPIYTTKYPTENGRPVDRDTRMVWVGYIFFTSIYSL